MTCKDKYSKCNSKHQILNNNNNSTNNNQSRSNQRKMITPIIKMNSRRTIMLIKKLFKAHQLTINSKTWHNKCNNNHLILWTMIVSKLILTQTKTKEMMNNLMLKTSSSSNKILSIKWMNNKICRTNRTSNKSVRCFLNNNSNNKPMSLNNKLKWTKIILSPNQQSMVWLLKNMLYTNTKKRWRCKEITIKDSSKPKKTTNSSNKWWILLVIRASNPNNNNKWWTKSQANQTNNSNNHRFLVMTRFNSNNSLINLMEVFKCKMINNSKMKIKWINRHSNKTTKGNE